ncbi:MAG TPA: hypothetical protein VGL89_18040 [Candidatus Koribacter sp.]|jgi:hypothetical protein
MKALLASSILVFTIGLAICIGIGAGYAVICGILNTFGRRREKDETAGQVATAPSLGD